MDKYTIIVSGILYPEKIQDSLQKYYSYPVEHLTIQDGSAVIFVTSDVPLNSVQFLVERCFNVECGSNIWVSVIPYDVFERYLSGKTNS